ncbi:hypothetical protein XENOCAPTIV_012083 [Xenoophorus captivus]|uniref:Secreted protein n=1 Tax=Xenoophorus captivus TaxID=1517983 RepID=A0ABV0SFX9_9TELE
MVYVFMVNTIFTSQAFGNMYTINYTTSIYRMRERERGTGCRTTKLKRVFKCSHLPPLFIPSGVLSVFLQHPVLKLKNKETTSKGNIFTPSGKAAQVFHKQF